MRKQILINCIIFFAGIVVGGLIASFYFGNTILKLDNFKHLQFLADWEERAFQAYSKNEPEVATWALENLLDILENTKKTASDKDMKLIQTDLLFTHTRLAITASKLNDTEKYDQNISKALAIAKAYYPGDIQNEDDLIGYIKRVDDKVMSKGGNSP